MQRASTDTDHAGAVGSGQDVDWAAASPTPVRLSESVAARIEDMIVSGRLAPGQRLPPERQLAELLGVSRGLAREAIRELELKGLVARRPGRGTHVRAPHRSEFTRMMGGYLAAPERELAEVLDLRDMLEPAIAARAAERASDSDIAEVQKASDLLDAETDPIRAAELDARFHLAVARCTKNSVIIKLVETEMEALGDHRREHLRTTARQGISRDAHRAILAAIQMRDGEAAERAMHEHIRSVAERLSATWRSSSTDRQVDGPTATKEDTRRPGKKPSERAPTRSG